jgi:hypothetical protein
MMMIVEDFLPSVWFYELALIGGHHTSRRVNLGIDDDTGRHLTIRQVKGHLGQKY